MKDNTIYEELKIGLEKLTNSQELSAFWNEKLFYKIDECKKDDKSTIKDCKNLVDIIFSYNGKCLNGYNKLLEQNSENTTDAKLFYIFAEASRTHLNLIQDKSNRLIYKKSTSRFWMGIVIAIITSVISIVITCYYGKNPVSCSCCSFETKQTQTTSEEKNSKVDDTVLPMLDTISNSE